jgi:hypothetical protein
MLLGTHLELCWNTLKTTKIQKNCFTLVVIDILVICALASAFLSVDFLFDQWPILQVTILAHLEIYSFCFQQCLKIVMKHFCLSFFMFPTFKMANSSKEIGLIFMA